MALFKLCIVRTIVFAADPYSPQLLFLQQELRDQRLCKICMSREANIVFVPCGHLATCGSCATAFRNCPVCRSKIQQAVKTFMS